MDFGDKSIDLSVASRVNKLNSLLHGMFQKFFIVDMGMRLTSSFVLNLLPHAAVAIAQNRCDACTSGRVQ